MEAHRKHLKTIIIHRFPIIISQLLKIVVKKKSREALPTFHGYAQVRHCMQQDHYGRVRDHQVLREMKVNVLGR